MLHFKFQVQNENPFRIHSPIVFCSLYPISFFDFYIFE
ncbi:hypothetical protein LEP1GSC016_1416 [Leptospira borgpetersenii serovar Hardjo-bovis str. Sponselee]|uniref:Uncharacterized protein n=5 Tax=Leptospira borgpetersenii TaxID=174 RepID=M3HSY0_LEPBO|nr:hypothetical protein LEP1GSC128_1293 [Leptospira borgpetersenii str. 200801926]EMG01171.1 hypothetical protein LEP1GSC123_0987 [Leptospira borgpetersenii str. 200701203]EMJ80350.1 hypothetical protein LEP1GSC016_1416 [Leptospira borgpetersenii serovar Hardjo-bovis str. Sponselee]EMK13813.1 hypothetical protein LEP1GSC066_0806 [Leptospira sp. serovar Kenya str. Sh9]EMN12905.1 hypothetical protein LEP1GSC055_2841 [Leptospira borgpetersenii str. Brem 307]EMN16635.1 hypothetical protein LEP1GSC